MTLAEQRTRQLSAGREPPAPGTRRIVNAAFDPRAS